jgi:hypothetical protein
MHRFLSAALISAAVMNAAFFSIEGNAELKKAKLNTIRFSALKRRDVIDYKAVQNFQPPKELEIRVGSAHIDGNRVMVDGELINPDPNEKEVIAYSMNSMGGPLDVELIPNSDIKPRQESDTYGGRPPLVAPQAPWSIEIPGWSRVQFTALFDLTKYSYAGSPVGTFAWTFHYWKGQKPTGTLSIKLPAR